MIYFVATPIGNLKDITLRALETLRDCDVIFCEDTRHTIGLLNAYEIKKPLSSCHKFNEREAAEKIVRLSREGKNICIVSDAGMPAVSDPGREVIAVLRENGVPFTVLPGANAFLSALVLGGYPAEGATFVGFLPDKNKDRREKLEAYRDYAGTLAFHCAPQDVDDYVAAMYAVWGDRRACAVREITKLHEETQFFTLAEGLKGEKRGEYVLLVEGAEKKQNPLCALSVREHVRHYMDLGEDKKEALKLAARDRGVSKNALYKETLDL